MAVPHALDLSLSPANGIESLSSRMEANAARSWVGNDTSQRNQHGVVPKWDSPLTLALGWRERAGAPLTAIGTFSLDLHRLLAKGLIRTEDEERVRIRFLHETDGSIYLQTKRGAPRVRIGRF